MNAYLLDDINSLTNQLHAIHLKMASEGAMLDKRHPAWKENIHAVQAKLDKLWDQRREHLFQIAQPLTRFPKRPDRPFEPRERKPSKRTKELV